MEYRWAVGEGQRGAYRCIPTPSLEIRSPAEAWGSTGISDLGGLGGDETPVEV